MEILILRQLGMAGGTMKFVSHLHGSLTLGPLCAGLGLRSSLLQLQGLL